MNVTRNYIKQKNERKQEMSEHGVGAAVKRKSEIEVILEQFTLVNSGLRKQLERLCMGINTVVSQREEKASPGPQKEVVPSNTELGNKLVELINEVSSISDNLSTLVDKIEL